MCILPTLSHRNVTQSVQVPQSIHFVHEQISNNVWNEKINVCEQGLSQHRCCSLNMPRWDALRPESSFVIKIHMDHIIILHVVVLLIPLPVFSFFVLCNPSLVLSAGNVVLNYPPLVCIVWASTHVKGSTGVETFRQGECHLIITRKGYFFPPL